MRTRVIVGTLGVLFAGNICVIAGDPVRIAEAVAAMNARAAAAAADVAAEDGSPPADDAGPAAWTVLNPLAGGGSCAIDVGVFGAAVAAQVTDVVNNIVGDPRVASVTGVVITALTPTLAELQAFDAVLVFTNSTPQNNVLLGDNLADYVDAGGGVVLAMFAMRASVATRIIEGRFGSANYYCIERSVGTSTTGAATLGTIYEPGSPLVQGVTVFEGGTSFRPPTPPHPSATRIADWSSGEVLIAQRTDLAGGRVDLGFFAVSSSGSAGSWNPATHGGAMLRNAVVVASRCLTPPPPFGACCLASGACSENQSAENCQAAGGTYRGDGTDCTPNNCPQPGACCASNGSCQLLLQSACAGQGGMFLGGGTVCGATNCLGGCCRADDTCVLVSADNCASQNGEFRGAGTDCTASCAVTMEIEPNETKAQATPVAGPMDDTECITGNTTGSSTTVPGPASADTWLIEVADRPLGIYRHRLEYSSDTPFHGSTIRGLNQTDGADGGVIGTLDGTVQTASTTTSPPRFVQWYGFGHGERLYFRVTGTTTTTADYRYCLSTTAVTATDIGQYAPGQIVITTVGQGHSTDTDLWVYDGNLNAIPGFGCDDESVAAGGTGTTLQSLLNRTYTDGIYYLALTNFNFANNLPSPEDDDFETGLVLDFPNAAANSSTTTALNLTFTISDSAGAVQQVAATKPGPFEIAWFKFIVGSPCPGPRGDINCDGLVNFFDIDPFLLALFDPPAYAAMFCGGSICTVDVNCDGLANFFDIDGFIACLFSACPPCP